MNASEKSNTLIGIMIVAVSMIGLIIFFTRVGFDLTPVEDVHLEKVVTVEGYANSFCDSYVGNNNELNKECSNLTKKNCLSTSCCVYSKMNGKEGCFSGNEHGPTYRYNDVGKTNEIDYYYYKNKCYGDSCKLKK